MVKVPQNQMFVIPKLGGQWLQNVQYAAAARYFSSRYHLQDQHLDRR